MKYREFGAAGMDVSLLGFGTMRLPILNKDSSQIDEAEATKMIRHAIDSGVNYIDTAYLYHNYKGEAFVGKALKDGYREKVLLATKLAFWLLDGPDKLEAMFNEQLEKLQTDHIDMYLMHAIADDTWDQVREWKIWDFCESKRAEGKIRFIGFSYHGNSPEDFKKGLDEYPWDFVQLQLNYLDTDLQAGIEGYEYAVSKGIPVVIMEPLKGGKLTHGFPPGVQKLWDDRASNRPAAEWGLRWLANLPGVLTILSGMSNMEQLEENMRVLSDAEAGGMSADELAFIDKVVEEYRKLKIYQCTACKYCMPCPVDLDIPYIIDLRNQVELFGMSGVLKGEFNFNVEQKPSSCTACGACEAKCPQHIRVIKAMDEAAELFETP